MPLFARHPDRPATAPTPPCLSHRRPRSGWIVRLEFTGDAAPTARSPHPRPDGRPSPALGHPRSRLDRRAIRGRAAPRYPPTDRRRRIPQPRPGPRLRRRARRTHRLRLLRRTRPRPAVDIVYVASPHSEHHRQARLALEAGKPVLVEKAFTRNAAEARDLIDLAQANGLFVLEGMWSRFLPHYDVIAPSRARRSDRRGDHRVRRPRPAPLPRRPGPARQPRPRRRRAARPRRLPDLVRRLRPRPLHHDHRHRQPHRPRRRPTREPSPWPTRQARSASCTPPCSPHHPAPPRSAAPTAAWTSQAPSTCPPRSRSATATAQFIDRYDPTGDIAHQGLRYEAAEAARCLTAGATESPLHPPATTLRIMQAMDEVRRQLGVHFPGE